MLLHEKLQAEKDKNSINNKQACSLIRYLRVSCASAVSTAHFAQHHHQFKIAFFLHFLTMISSDKLLTDKIQDHPSLNTTTYAAHTDPGELKNMRNSITLEFMQWYESIGLRMMKNLYINDCYVQLILCHTESNLCMNSRVMEFCMFLSSPGSVCGPWIKFYTKPTKTNLN